MPFTGELNRENRQVGYRGKEQVTRREVSSNHFKLVVEDVPAITRVESLDEKGKVRERGRNR